MSKTNKKENVKNLNKWHGYYMEDLSCTVCKYFQGKKQGCKLDTCCCEDEKRDAIANKRIKRRRGTMTWDE